MRGILNEKIQFKAKEVLGREITQTELRLYPYIDYVIKNGGYCDRSKLSREEQQLLYEYPERLLNKDYGGYIHISKEFYSFIQHCLWESYVEFKIGEEEEEK